VKTRRSQKKELKLHDIEKEDYDYYNRLLKKPHVSGVHPFVKRYKTLEAAKKRVMAARKGAVGSGLGNNTFANSLLVSNLGEKANISTADVSTLEIRTPVEAFRGYTLNQYKY
jgi:hypothetical protein